MAKGSAIGYYERVGTNMYVPPNRPQVGGDEVGGWFAAR
jgi:hypothetical protein